MTPGLTGAGTAYVPTDLAGVRDAVLAACDDDANITVRGGGTKLGWLAPQKPPATSAGRPDMTIDTRQLTGLVEHDPGDMTATVLAGTPLDDLQPRLAAAGQQLAVDPPRRGGGPTVGGILAANDAGPRRMKYGGIRDLVIGTTVVLADGTISRSGGRVIKNVAGYDLGKLWCGSLGTLGVITEITVRLHPLPEATRTLRIEADAGQATAFVTDLQRAPVECSTVEWAEPQQALLVELAGRAAGLGKQVDALAALARETELTAEELGDDGAQVWECWREAHDRGDHAGGDRGDSNRGDITVARASTKPSDLASCVGALNDAAHDTPVSAPASSSISAPISASVHSHAGLGLHDAVLTGGSSADHARVVAGWRERVTRVTGGSGTVVLRNHRDGVADHVDMWGVPPQPLLQLMRQVKSVLDPHGRMSPGRFVGGI
jgi:glycolate oxidase FAD binding subunit